MDSMSPEKWEVARANWNATMAAYYNKGYSASQSSCAKDIRTSFPACMQYAQDWCWATAVAELSHFFKPEDYPEKSNDCHGIECKIAGFKRDPTYADACCNGTQFCGKAVQGKTCCKGRILGFPTCENQCGFMQKEVDEYACRYDQCGAIGGNEDDIVGAIKRLTGKNYANKTDGPLTQEQLNTVLSKGHPVILVIMWSPGPGGHAVTLGGCAPPAASGGNATYYLHDPLDKAGAYQELSYDQVADYKPPWDKTVEGYWTYTFWLDGDEQEVSVESAAEIVV
jgi:hypothetical protein